MSGCKSASPPETSKPVLHAVAYPARPSVSAPTFKLFHSTDNSLTLVTKENATDEEIEAILWQLRDAAAQRSFGALKLPQTFVDKRDPIVWFHIYRGAKCAPEKYISPPPCGPSYHSAGDFSYGGFTNHDRADGELIHDEDHQQPLWNPDAPYSSTH